MRSYLISSHVQRNGPLWRIECKYFSWKCSDYIHLNQIRWIYKLLPNTLWKTLFVDGLDVRFRVLLCVDRFSLIPPYILQSLHNQLLQLLRQLHAEQLALKINISLWETHQFEQKVKNNNSIRYEKLFFNEKFEFIKIYIKIWRFSK